MKVFVKLTCGALLALSTAGCVGAALPPGTLVQPGYVPPPPPPAYGPPPRRCFFRDGPYGPERVCRSPAYY